MLKKGEEIEDKIITNLSYIFEFNYGITRYLSPKKITPVFFFKNIKIKPKKDSDLYLKFKQTVKKVFKHSEFKILHYKEIFNTIQIVFEYIPSQYEYPHFHKNAIANNFYYSYFINLKERFLFNSNKLKKIISEKDIKYIYRIELLRKIYNFTELGICKESKHLLIKYIKMLFSASKYIMRNHHQEDYFVYLELGDSTVQDHLKHLYYLIKEEKESPYLFLGKDKEELSEGDLWVPRKGDLKNLLFKDILDRTTLTVIRYHQYQQWRKKHKISIKCEELNLFAYYMEIKHNRIWDSNKWKSKPPPPQKVFKINDYLTLKLESNTTNIYIRGKHFNHCKYLLFSFTHEELSEYEEIKSIDEIKEKYDNSHETKHDKISPEIEFWGHCSNIQTWYEYEYDTRILHSNIAFPLLKELSKQGDPLAKKVFKEEIALRFESNHETVITFLLEGKYLEYLDLDEIEILSKNLDFEKWTFPMIHLFFWQWILKAKDDSELTKKLIYEKDKILTDYVEYHKEECIAQRLENYDF